MPTTAPIAATASGDTVIVAGQAGRRVRVLGFLLSFSGTVTAKLKDSGADLTGLLYGAAGSNVQAHPPAAPNVQPTPAYLFQAAAGSDLTLNLSGAVPVGGYVVYDLVPAGM